MVSALMTLQVLGTAASAMVKKPIRDGSGGEAVNECDYEGDWRSCAGAQLSVKYRLGWGVGLVHNRPAMLRARVRETL